MSKQAYHKPKQKAKIGLTLNQVQRSIIQREVTEKTMLMLIGIPLIVLRDKYGFGKKRLETFSEEVLLQLKCVENGKVGLDEIHDIIKKETGMEVSNI